MARATGSISSDQEARESYHLLASRFITKPLEYEQLLRVVKGIGDYWLTLVRLPAEG